MLYVATAFGLFLYNFKRVLQTRLVPSGPGESGTTQMWVLSFVVSPGSCNFNLLTSCHVFEEEHRLVGEFSPMYLESSGVCSSGCSSSEGDKEGAWLSDID